VFLLSVQKLSKLKISRYIVFIASKNNT